MNPPKCDELDYIHFLIAAQKVFTCTEAARCQLRQGQPEILSALWNGKHQGLDEGYVADVAVLRLAEGDFGFVDIERRRLSGKWRLQCALTIRKGEVVWDLDGLSWPDWREGR